MRSLHGLLGVALLASGWPRSPVPHRRSSGSATLPWRPDASCYRPHQGKRETERRRRQIAAGRLTEANGLSTERAAVRARHAAAMKAVGL